MGDETMYGVDMSWPIHHARVSTNYPWLPHNLDPTLPVPDEYQGMPVQPLGNVWDRYQRYMDGCYTYWEEKVGQGMECNRTEHVRLVGNLKQPLSVRNYTAQGYKKIRAPDQVFRLLQEFWQNNKDLRQ